MAEPALPLEPRIAHAVPGRLRVHLPSWTGAAPRTLEERVRRGRGIASVQANAVTGNLLIRYDTRATSPEAILEVVRDVEVPAPAPPAASAPAPAPTPRAERLGTRRRVRVSVRGIDRDLGLARRVEEYIEVCYGAVARANPLTGRVLVEFEEGQLLLEDLVAELVDIELPPLPDEKRPAHPLDPEPLVAGLIRGVGGATGLAVLSVTRALKGPGARIGNPRAGEIAAILSLVQAFPMLRASLRRLLGPLVADVLLGATGLTTMTIAGSVVGLALTGLHGLLLLTEELGRRAAWKRYEDGLPRAIPARAGATVRVEAGERVPLGGRVVDGLGFAQGRDGLPTAIAPGETVPSDAALYGGPFTVRLGEPAAVPPPSPTIPYGSPLVERYLGFEGPAALGYAAVTGLAARSPGRALESLVLVNPRVAVVGADAADLAAAARVVRAGATVVGTRPERVICRPDVLLLEGPHVLADGFEIGHVLPLADDVGMERVRAVAAGVAAAAGSPWGRLLPAAESVAAADGVFDGEARATVDGVGYRLRPLAAEDPVPGVRHLLHRGDYPLLLSAGAEGRPIGVVALRPRLVAGLAELTATCDRLGVRVAVAGAESPAGRAIARRAGVHVHPRADPVAAVLDEHERGRRVAVVGSTYDAAPAFAACDLAIGLIRQRSEFAAPADLLAPDFATVASIVETGHRREVACRDAVALSAAANVGGVVWGLRGRPGIVRAADLSGAAALTALVVAWARLHGGGRARQVEPSYADPRPERWGRQSVERVFAAQGTRPSGLSDTEVARRRRPVAAAPRARELLSVLLDQVRSPLIGVLAVGAGLSLAFGAVVDVGLIAAVIATNVAVGAWQERRAVQATEALARMGAVTARVVREGGALVIPAEEVVPGDVLHLAAGDRVAADARLFSSRGLEVDEALLTGESLPVAKAHDAATDEARIVLAGTDVVAGTGLAVVVAVGDETRMGATRAALAGTETGQSPLGVRLSRMLTFVLPIAVSSGALVAVTGVLHRRPVMAELALGTSIAVAAVPEGLPLLARLGEAGVAQRLAKRRALVRRLAAIEALGRVDVACADKTGTMTEGRLALRAVADMATVSDPNQELDPGPRHILYAAAIASPHPEGLHANSHPTDVAVAQGARDSGLASELRVTREAESPFEPGRAFHATVVRGTFYAKGAPEALAPRCAWIRRGETDVPVGADGQAALLDRAQALAQDGLRVLLVVEGDGSTSLTDPGGLTALGFIGISDPLKATVPAAVRQCREAGVRVIMLTGDHPATARAIAREAGLLDGGELLTGPEIDELDDDALGARLARVSVVARTTPLHKTRIIRGLQRRGRVVAMTGDGANDGPALRLADVGVAMGSGTEVARQAADVVLVDDDFGTLVAALIEGRSFWRNIRWAVGLLIGGNLGEIGLLVIPSVFGLTPPLNTRQVLTVNMLSDVLPALAVTMQKPAQRHLSALAREGEAGLEAPLRHDIYRRGVATAAPSLLAYALTLSGGEPAQAATAAFTTLVATQLTQTVDLGLTDTSLSWPIAGAATASLGMLAGFLAIPPLRGLLALAAPAPATLALTVAASLVAPAINRVLTGLDRLPRLALPAPASAAVAAG